MNAIESVLSSLSRDNDDILKTHNRIVSEMARVYSEGMVKAEASRKSISKKLDELSDLRDMYQRIIKGKIREAEVLVNEGLIDPSMTDEGYIKALQEIMDTPASLGMLRALNVLIGKISESLKRLGERRGKLLKRVGDDTGEERSAARGLATRLDENIAILERRYASIIGLFFQVRKAVLEEIARQSDEMFLKLPEGLMELTERESLKYGIEDSVKAIMATKESIDSMRNRRRTYRGRTK